MGSVHQVGSRATPKTLRVLSRGTALVPDYEALKHPTHSVRRFHGWRHDPSHGDLIPEQDGQGRWAPSDKRQGAFAKLHDEVVEVPDSAEVRRHLRGDERSAEWDGDLWPADEETALFVDVPFDPTFGGEHPEVSKAFESDKRYAKFFQKAAPAESGTRVPSPAPALYQPPAKETP